MKKTPMILTTLAMALMGATLASCDDKEPDHSEFSPSTVPYDPSISDRAYLEQTAIKLLDNLKPRDQQQLIQVLHQFVANCTDSELPENFAGDYTGAARAASSLAQALEGCDPQLISRAATEYAYTMARFKGLYQYNNNTQRWQRLEDSEQVVFRFWVGTKEYNIAVSAEGGSWTERYDIDGYTYVVDVPKTLDLLIVDGALSLKPESIMTANIKTDGRNGDHLNCTSDITAANIVIQSEYQSTANRIHQTTTLNIDNVSTYYRTRAIVATSEVSGHNLCSIDAWRQLDDARDPAEAMAAMITSVSSTVMVMDMVQLKTKVLDVRPLVSYIDRWWTPWDCDDPQAQAQQAADELTRALTTDVYYAGNTANNPVRARVRWEAYQPYPEWDEPEWTVRPLIVFTSDDTPYDFASYFGDGRFLSVENNLNYLLRTYKSYWK